MIRRRDREFFFEFPLYEDENCKSGDFRVTTVKPSNFYETFFFNFYNC